MAVCSSDFILKYFFHIKDNSTSVSKPDLLTGKTIWISFCLLFFLFVLSLFFLSESDSVLFSFVFYCFTKSNLFSFLFLIIVLGMSFYTLYLFTVIFIQFILKILLIDFGRFFFDKNLLKTTFYNYSEKKQFQVFGKKIPEKASRILSFSYFSLYKPYNLIG